MAQVVIRDIEKDLKVRLQRRAARNGRSLEEEIREILRDAAKEEHTATGGMGTEISLLFSKIRLEKDENIPEFRGSQIRLPKL
jgi:antitoxin FitA